jgi:hypothetical protein
MSDEDLWEAARARTREDVRQIFARIPEAPHRTCPHCGEQSQTREEHCPACGRSYFERPDRFSPRTRRLLQVVGGLAAAALLALVVVVLVHQARDNGASAREKRAAAAAAERARLTHEQRPHHAVVAALRDDRRGAGAVRLEHRAALVNRLEAAITTDARERVARHELRARSIRSTSCHALANDTRGDELDLRNPLGRYACEAAVETASNAGITSTLGVPFVGTIDFRSGRLTWCKDNPTSASDIKSSLAFVRLSRECTAARGPVFGSGYLIEPRR